MKIRTKFLLLFLALLAVSLSITGYINFKTTEDAVVNSAIKSMENELSAISSTMQAFHEKAGGELVFAVGHPAFREYFSLPETKAGNRYGKGDVITFTKRQAELKKKIDEWALNLQKRFPIVETCLIDKMGQEHSRITRGTIAPDDDFSREEHAAPFFAPTFRIGGGDFHVQYPYMSHDAKEWVFSYTTPIVLEDGSRPAIYHFEIPVAYYQALVSRNTTGRTIVLDPLDMVVADSARAISTAMAHEGDGLGHDEAHEFKLSDYLPSSSAVFKDEGFRRAVESMKSSDSGTAAFREDGKDYYVVYRKLPSFGWTVAQIKSYDELLTGKTSLGRLKWVMAATVLFCAAAAFLVIYTVTGRITDPLGRLTASAKKVADGDLGAEMPRFDTKDEVADLSAALADMVGGLKDMIRDVSAAALEVDRASRAIKQGSDEVSMGMGEQAGKAMQIASACEEMSRSIVEIAKEASSIASTANGALGLAEKGESIVGRSISEVKAISSNVDGMSMTIGALSERSREIGDIVGVIDDIAEQTKLLALNAAIEAARAGEEGRGFAVVADEVKKLSERTADSTQRISAMIKAMQGEVDAALGSMEEGTRKVADGVAFSAQAGAALHDIVGAVKGLNAMVERIVTATTQMSTVSENISADIGSIATLSKKTSARTGGISESAGGMAELSDSLRAVMGRVAA